MRKSVSSTYFTATAVLLVASITVMGLVQTYLFKNYFTDERREALGDVVQIAAGQVERGQQIAQILRENPELFEKMRESVALIGQTTSAQVLFTDAAGQLTLCSEGPGCRHEGEILPEGLRRQIAQQGDYFEVSDLAGAFPSKYYVAARPLLGAEGEVAGFVVAASSAAGMATFLGDMFSSFILSAGLMLLVSSVLSVLLTGRLTGPLRRIAEAARRFGGGDFSVRVPVDGDDEVAQLAVTFNNMAANLEAIDTSRSSFMGNIAHELRTPMTSVKGFIDGMLDGTIPPQMHQHYLNLVSQEVGRLARLVQNMLDITKLEAGEYQVKAQSYDIWETITNVVFGAEKRIEAGKVAIQGLAPARTLVYADPDLVYQVVFNLVDNALKFTPEGGAVRFGVQKSGQQVVITVRNTGEGISEDTLPFVFDRFYKADQSRGLNPGGSGLGLHICKVLVGISGGKIWAESKQGEWCQFTFTLPQGPADGKKAARGYGGAAPAK